MCHLERRTRSPGVPHKKRQLTNRAAFKWKSRVPSKLQRLQQSPKIKKAVKYSEILKKRPTTTEIQTQEIDTTTAPTGTGNCHHNCCLRKTKQNDDLVEK